MQFNSPIVLTANQCMTAVFPFFVYVLYTITDKCIRHTKINININILSPSCCPFGNSPLEMNLLIFFRIFLLDLEGWNFGAWHLDREHDGKGFVRKTHICIYFCLSHKHLIGDVMYLKNYHRSSS